MFKLTEKERKRRSTTLHVQRSHPELMASYKGRGKGNPSPESTCTTEQGRWGRRWIHSRLLLLSLDFRLLKSTLNNACSVSNAKHDPHFCHTSFYSCKEHWQWYVSTLQIRQDVNANKVGNLRDKRGFVCRSRLENRRKSKKISLLQLLVSF